jgi:hypothetical protein
MDKRLTAGDLATYHVDVATAEGTQSHIVTAAYTATEPGWLLLKDHEHRTVAQFSAHIVIMVRRAEPDTSDASSDEDRIRDAMAEARDHPGRVVTR